jgi:TetR/AcrR family transcriptional regulator, cholesterol catabolism regulator
MVQFASGASGASAATPATAEDRAADKRQEILAAASQLFRSKGLHATGMRDIAAELGMAVGNLYYYFSSKDSLLAYCQNDTLNGLVSGLREVASESTPADLQLYRAIVAHVVRLNEAIPGSLAHLEVEALESRLRKPILERRRVYENALRELIDQGVASGVFRPCDTKIQTLAMLGAMNWTVKWFRPSGQRSARQIGEEFALTLVRGLLADGRSFEAPAESTSAKSTARRTRA